MTESDLRRPIVERHDFLGLVRSRAEHNPDGVAFVDYDVHAGRASGGLEPSRTTYAEFYEATLALAVALQDRGIGAGDVVAIQLPNRHEFAMAHLALYAIGAVVMPVSPIYRTRDLARMLSISSAAGLLVPSSFGSFDYLAMVTELLAELPSLRVLVEVGPRTGGRFENLDDLLAEGSAGGDGRDAIVANQFVPGVGEPVMLNFTSGTTGEPKGVLHSRETLATGVLATTDRLELDGDDVIFVAATLGHAGGFLNGIFMPLLLGARVVFLNVWEPGVALRVLEAERVTYAAMMPPYLVDLTRHPDFAAADLGSWRTARVSGGVIPRRVMNALHERLPGLALCPGWGMSESLYVTCAGPGDPVERRNSTDGRVLSGCEIDIRDPADDLRSLPAGKAGQIVIKAPSLMIGYFDRPELTESMYLADGWFKTGDLGSVSEDGYLTIGGRIKDIVLRGGENIPIVEVEMLLMSHEKVMSVSVVGVPDERLGERACAVVVSNPALPPLSFEEMGEYLAEKGLTHQFIPEYLVISPEMPVTAHGKIRKADVKEIALGALGLAGEDDAKDSP